MIKPIGTATSATTSLLAVPPGVVTVIAPLFAPSGTAVAMRPFAATSKSALTNITDVAPTKWEPTSCTGSLRRRAPG